MYCTYICPILSALSFGSVRGGLEAMEGMLKPIINNAITATALAEVFLSSCLNFPFGTTSIATKETNSRM